MLRSCRNQSIDLQCKSIDWFLFEGNIFLIWVKKNFDAINFVKNRTDQVPS